VDTNYPGLFVEMRDLSVPKIRFCNNSDEVRRGRAQVAEMQAAIEEAHAAPFPPGTAFASRQVRRLAALMRDELHVRLVHNVHAK
jgi:multidrug resistance efflux pump